MHAIYGIVINNKIYVGSAIDYFKRIAHHQSMLTTNKHKNRYLQNAWNKYSKCEIKILEEVKDKKDLIEREQYWIDKLQSADVEFGYNLSPLAKSTLGIKLGPQSIDTKLKKSIKMQNVPKSKEHKIKIGLANRKLEKWPHGSKCKCRECSDKRNKMSRNCPSY